MKTFNKVLLSLFLLLSYSICLLSKNYYVHPIIGSDVNMGLTKESPFRQLSSISKLDLQPGDRILLAANQEFNSSLELKNQSGTASNRIVITSYNWSYSSQLVPATINFKGQANGILIQDCNYITISNIKLAADGYLEKDDRQIMRCGILIKTNKADSKMSHIKVERIAIDKVYFENKGFIRGKEEIKTANGSQRYGWGIRVINNQVNSIINSVFIHACSISNVSHTGIKLTGEEKNITDVSITENVITKVGGPGIQMSNVKDVHVANNTVTYSGSNDDSRKWGRGSGLWTWSASRVLIEHNKFMYANGPGDSAGAHIDFNCDNVIIQYNLSAYNTGGFCEILGNNYNCAYRYNVSVNDGHRVKGVDGAFQEGKLFWLSGYLGNKAPKKGPVNTYFYNNTIYSDSSIVAKIAIESTSKGILIANNLFYILGPSKVALGDQMKVDTKVEDAFEDVFFKKNVFLNANNWPKDSGIFDQTPIYGDPKFVKVGGLSTSDYKPTNKALIRNKGIDITLINKDSIGLMKPLKVEFDILGRKVGRLPSIGAVEP